MDALLLPLVREDQTLKSALQAMRHAGRSGLVWERDNGFYLFTAASVVHGIARKDHTLQDLFDRPGGHITVKVVDVANTRTVAGHLDLPGLEKMLKGSPGYGVLATGKTKGRVQVLVFTESEKFGEPLEPSPSDCYCPKGDHPVARGQLCPIHRVKPDCDDVQ